MTVLAPPAPTPAPGRPPAAAPRPVSWLASLLGGLTLLGGATALTAVLSGPSWWGPAIQMVLVVVAVGIGCRLVRLPVWVTAPLQLLAVAMTLTVLFSTNGWARFVPNAEVFAEARRLLRGAWAQIMGTVPPAPTTVELTFMVCLALGVVAVLMDLMIAETRTPALVALPLLCLFSVPASVSPYPLPWYAFAAPAAGFCLLLAVAGHGDRRFGWRAGLSVATTTVVLGALAVVGAMIAGQLTTAVGTEGRLPRTTPTTGQVGLSPFTDLAGDLRRSDPIHLLTVRGPVVPEYVRTATLSEWVSNEGWQLGDLAVDSVPTPRAGVEVGISSVGFRDRFLPIMTGTSFLTSISSTWDYDAGQEIFHRPDPVDPGTYSILADLARPTSEALREDAVTPGGRYTETGVLPAEVVRLAREVTADAATPFDRAQALQEWFTDPASGFTYSLSVPQGNSGDLLVDFLEQRQGYCEQYASAMAVMLRSLDIPARVAIGFTQGTPDGTGGWTVTSHDAHAWVEVRFDQHGWVRFDPTPLSAGQGGQQGFVEPEAPEPSASAAPSTVSAPPSPTAVPAPEVEPSPSVVPSPTADAAAPAAPGASDGSSGLPTWLWWLLPGLALLVLVVVGPRRLRLARRRRRERTGGTGPSGAVLAWAELEDLMVDHRIGPSSADSARVAANRLAKQVRLPEEARAGLRSIVTTAELAWYAPATDSSAQRPEPGPTGASGVATLAPPAVEAPTEHAQWWATVDAVARGLSEHVPLSWRDRWWPRSLRR